MANFLAELKRRHIYRVGAAYVIAAWAVAQVVDLLSQVFSLPPWIAQPTIIVLAVGFPIVLVIAWIAESKPQEAIASVVRSKPTVVDWMLFAAVAVLIALNGYRLIAPSPDMATQTGVEAARAAAASPTGAISVAVLPFANLSSDPEQEFFSDGMTEEITAALAKVPELRVVARTSAFEFKGQNRNIQNIGEQLHATHLIEGSVRKAGDRVRITVLLIKADDGTHLWSESYDRQLADVFAIQEDIARTVTASFNMSLNLRPGESLVNNRIDPESYQQYLRAKALVGARGQTRITEAAELLEQVVARNPDYAPAWALLGLSYQLRPNSSPERTSGPVEEYRKVVDTLRTKAEAAGQRAVALDPNLADGYIVLANVLGSGGHILQAFDISQSKIFVLDPNNGQALHGDALGLSILGYVKQALAMRLKLMELEPTVQNYNIRAALVLWLDGQNDAAITILRDLPSDRTDALAMIFASMGRYSDAIDVIEKMPASSYPPGTREQAVRLLRMAPAKVASLQDLPPLGVLGWVYLYAGAPERVLDVYERGIEGGYMAGAGNPESLWHAAYAPVRKTERFKSYARRAGLVEFWRARGWPEQCRPTAGDDFACD